jgi:hypothetical protein
MDFGIFTMVTNMGSCSPKANDYGTLLFFSQVYQIILPFPLKVAMVLTVSIFTMGRGSFYLGS